MLPKNSKALLIYSGLLVLLLITLLLSIRYGGVDVSVSDMLVGLRKSVSGNPDLTLYQRIFIDIRLPRALMACLVGAVLAVGGTLMQALFRNPIVEPGLIGTSSGAAFGAALYFVLGASLHINAGEWTLPFAAGLGAVTSTVLVLVLSRSGKASANTVVSLLLTGMAINAIFMSGVGFLSYIARDPQARSITFWGLGNLSGANWHSVRVVGVTTLVCTIWSLRYARQLNALMLGEDDARFLGVDMKRLKVSVLLINVIMIAVATAFVGVVSFIGLVVPHLLRMIKGSDNRFLIPASALLGAILLSVADIVARMLLRPAELPLGIVTSIVGVPVFIILLRRKNYFF